MFINCFSGFTSDGDGLNDNWLVENIKNFPNNTVTIFY
ncbi:MAG: gliding motility-associated C-terminal domain-containing protein [Bacteroidetes bacterium]|nr:gliding motility-associated C-terminal domain-containing protein [Bacteroidota bacterium]